MFSGLSFSWSVCSSAPLRLWVAQLATRWGWTLGRPTLTLSTCIALLRGSSTKRGRVSPGVVYSFLSTLGDHAPGSTAAAHSQAWQRHPRATRQERPMQVRLLFTASAQLSGWLYWPSTSGGLGCAPNKARVEPRCDACTCALAAQALLHRGTQAAARTRRAFSAVRTWACIHPGCAGCEMASRHLSLAGVLWHCHAQRAQVPGAPQPDWLRVFLRSPTLCRLQTCPAFPGKRC